MNKLAKKLAFKIYSFLFAIFCLVAAFTLPVSAQNFSGEITDIKGTVQVSTSTENSWVNAIEGIPVLPNYRIKTDLKSSCIINLDDGSLIFIDENTSASIDILEITGDHHNSRFSLMMGKILANIEKSKNTKMEIKTPNSIAAVRGTEFAVEVNTVTTNVGVFDGKVAVVNPEVSPEEVLLNPDEETTVEKGAKPRKPEKLKEVMLRNKERMSSIREKVKALKEKLKRVPPEERTKMRKDAFERFNNIKKERNDLKEKIKDRNKQLLKRKI
ncbi:MAG: FecR domain-containing protein [Elusimicrobia bacterium]|nr:FecR domain-containing protein [Elusimicrobiota bacterium]